VKHLLMTAIMLAFCFGQSVYKTGGEVRLSPRLLNYQGYLTDTLGNPITNPSLSLSFAIFDNPSGGSQKWSETQGSVSVDKGIFNVLLGSVTPIPDSVFSNSTSRYLQMTVTGQVLSPRTRIVSAAYAYTSTYSDTAAYARSGAADNDWTRGTPDSILYTVNRVGISRGGSNNMAYGTERYTHINFGVNCTTGVDTANYFYATIGGGLRNKAASNYTVVAGGANNTVAGGASFIGSGWNNHAGAARVAIAGGHSDTSYSYYGFIGAGYSNMAGNDDLDTAATIGGGYDNSVNGKYGFIGGGRSNSISGFYGSVGGGQNNNINNNYGTIGGGIDNTTINNRAVIAGGSGNTATGDYTAVLGGLTNHASAAYSTVGGGRENFAGGGYSTIFGGYADTITAGAGYSYLFGINSNLTQDSTFLVDMPHVRFGTEAAGYEFPRTDGSNGQMLATNGSGQLNWSTVAGDADWIISANNMYSGVSGNVGIGTSSPGSKLEVEGSICGGYNNTVSGSLATILGGLNNYAYDSATAIVSGRANRIIGKYSFIGNGVNDTISSSLYSAIGGGQHNKLESNNYSFIGGGYSNAVSYSAGGTIGCGNYNLIYYGTSSFIGGGDSNSVNGTYGAIVGGRSNYINSSADYSIIGTGFDNYLSGDYSVILGGYQNRSTGAYSAIGGGYGDTVLTKYSAVLSGYSNKAGDQNYDTAAVVCGGLNNTAAGMYSFVGGGINNSTSTYYTTVCGGNSNTANQQHATVGGGQNNVAASTHATIAGGQNNRITNYGSAIGGGQSNTVSGYNGTIPGGYADTVAAGSGFAANSYSYCGHNNAAVFNGEATTASGQLRCGSLSKAGGTFTIDHPLDPMNKILNHYFVESPEMVNIYRGAAIIGSSGRAVVHLPDYFNALNQDPMIQLTGVKTSDVYVEDEVNGNRFVIGGKPGAKVFWTVTGERKDPSARVIATLTPVEQNKDGHLVGRSLDDDFLAVTLDQLKQMGKADGFKFRTAAGREKYEGMSGKR
jgi:hypothetical protein